MVCTDVKECDVEITYGKTYVVNRTTVLPVGVDEHGYFVELFDDKGTRQLCYAYRFVHKNDYLRDERGRRLDQLGV